MSEKVVKFHTLQGELVAYEKLSVRLPQFLQAFDPKEGYAVVTEFLDTLSLKPGLKGLYQAAVQSGQPVEACGLPALTLAEPTTICRATLSDPAGRVMASATAAKVIQSYKDLEVLETAARQRLVAALGYGGEVFDDDESRDRHEQGLDEKSPPEPRPVSVSSVDGSSVADKDQDRHEQGFDEKSASKPRPVSVSSVDGSSEADKDRALDDQRLMLLRRQIAHEAKVRGETPATVETLGAARAELKRLLQSR